MSRFFKKIRELEQYFYQTFSQKLKKLMNFREVCLVFHQGYKQLVFQVFETNDLES